MVLIVYVQTFKLDCIHHDSSSHVLLLVRFPGLCCSLVRGPCIAGIGVCSMAPGFDGGSSCRDRCVECEVLFPIVQLLSAGVDFARVGFAGSLCAFAGFFDVFLVVSRVRSTVENCRFECGV